MAMRSKAMLISAGAALFAAAGCAPVDPGFGEAHRYDMAIQTINPDPVYPADGAQPGDNGEKAQKATERYRKGTTKALRRESAGSGGGVGSGSGGSGAGGGNAPGS
ncbi:hypothetical protein LZ518_09745 [Sphingomonas sp. RB56-2]|uniref:Lipoprotein n=1 Tax=Sphingomonas brevis TaxID=2908206 RepID=A0ABT0SBA5_9SPHN|nr:hypothetical protein [Sphingomonas brevis]MCL6741412.1 hypothetical protein [Sphingomonas brevis]